MKQKEIILDLDKEFVAFGEIRRKIPEKIDSLIVILERLKNLNTTDVAINEFICFLKDLLFENYGQQRNNHNFMRAILDEKVKSHQRIQLNMLERSLVEGKIIYAKNVSPKKIMSNYFFSNENESKLSVSKLEKAFFDFTKSDRIYLNKKDDELDDLKKYFALQFTRREFFLQNIIKICLAKTSSEKSEKLDLLDYLHIKYIYNKAIPENYANWQESLKNNNILIQVQYCLPKIMKEYKDVQKDLDNGVNVERRPRNLAISEAHTLHLVSLIKAINRVFLKKSMKNNGVTPFTKKDLETIEGAVVTMGSNDKLCYLMSKEPGQKLIDKIDFVVQAYWDEIMANATLLNLLLSKESSLNSISTFKNTPQENRLNAEFMSEVFKISEYFEDIIKKESKLVLQKRKNESLFRLKRRWLTKSPQSIRLLR